MRKEQNSTSLKDLLPLLSPYKRNIALSILNNILLSLFTVVSIPLIIPFFQILFDSSAASPPPTNSPNFEEQLRSFFAQLIIDHGKNYALTTVCLLIIVVFFFKNLFRYLALFFMAPVRNGIVRDLRRSLFEKYIDLPIGFYENEKKGDLLSRATGDVQEIEWSILNVIEAIFKAPIIMIGSISFMIYISPPLSLFVLALLFFTAFIIGGISKTLKKSSAQVQITLGQISSIVEESLGGLRIIKVFNAQENQQAKFNLQNESYYQVLTKLLWRRDLSVPLSEFLGVTVVAVLLWYGSNLVFKSELHPETFFAFVFAFYQVIEPSKYFSSAYYNLQKGLAAMDRINTILQIENQIQDPAIPSSFVRFEKYIRFDRIRFFYPQSDTPAIDDLTLEIKAGEKIAVVGPSGGGKSTLIDLLVRYHDPQEGSISIDGKDLKTIRLTDLRSQFGMVNQEAILFHDTIAANIAFGHESADMDRVMEVAKIANAHDFISTTENAYQTNIGDKGVKLSGGQKQRITIARAIYHDPPILILDEATSALDSESEHLVQEALDKVMVGRTAIIVAHRLSTIQNADRIIVLEHGKIAEDGDHQSLMALGGIYAKMVSMQKI